MTPAYDSRHVITALRALMDDEYDAELLTLEALRDRLRDEYNQRRWGRRKGQTA